METPQKRIIMLQVGQVYTAPTGQSIYIVAELGDGRWHTSRSPIPAGATDVPVDTWTREELLEHLTQWETLAMQAEQNSPAELVHVSSNTEKFAETKSPGQQTVIPEDDKRIDNGIERAEIEIPDPDSEAAITSSPERLEVPVADGDKTPTEPSVEATPTTEDMLEKVHEEPKSETSIETTSSPSPSVLPSDSSSDSSFSAPKEKTLAERLKL